MHQTFATNVFGVVALTQALLPLIKKSEAGRIVNTSSGLGSLTLASDETSGYYAVEAFSYCASKTALNAFTVALAKELKGTAIKVNSNCPGFIATDLTDHLGHGTPEEGAREATRLALLPAGGPSGKFFNEAGAIAW
jgi:NAD(P)-dependent dehydrogenase (short-subunit alcohol dehydrogenase family)